MASSAHPVGEARITECGAYLRVDFGSCDRFELSNAYRSFAERCIGRQMNRVLLEAGDNPPEGHLELRATLLAMARSVGIAPDFKLALVASTLPVQAIYRETQRTMRALGVNTWVFDTVPRAVDWLEDRSTCPRMTS